MNKLLLAILFLALCGAFARDGQEFGYCSTPGLTGRDARDSLWYALSKLITNIEKRGSEGTSHNNINGKQFWAKAKCFNGLSHGKCRTCVDVLITTMWFACGEKSPGAHFRNRDCEVRYEPHGF